MRLTALIWGLAMLATQAIASGEVRSPVTGAMDAYFGNPRGPGTFRSLAGLGDPLFGTYPDIYGSSNSSDEQFQHDLDIGFGGNCRTDYARKTYNQRLKLGRDHPYFRQWIAVQKAVFANCKDWEKTPFKDMPPPIALDDPGLRRLQQDDREYQRASALFYGGEVLSARAQFAAIGSRSPHFSAAQFMLTAIDAGSQPDAYSPEVNAAALPRAEALLRNPARKDIRSYAQELIGWLGATADTPATREAQVRVTIDALELPIATLKSDPDAMARYRRASDDIGALHQDFDDPDWWLRAGAAPGYYGSAAMMKAAPAHHVAAWALIPAMPERKDQYEVPSGTPLNSEEGRAFLEKMVKGGADGLAWKTLQQQLAGEYDPKIWDEIDSAIARLRARPTEQDAALVPLLLQHQVRSGLTGYTTNWPDDGQPQRTRKVIDELAAYPFAQSDHFGVVTNGALRELMKQGKIREARELRDRVIARMGDSWRVSGTLVLLLAEDNDHLAAAIEWHGQTASALLNRLPSSKLAELAANPKLKPDERARFARAAWTRLYALKRPIPRHLDALMRELNPKITGSWQSKPGAQRGDHALLLDVLKSPAMNILATSRADSGYFGEATADTAIDVYLHSTNNWWCALRPENAASAADAEVDSAFGSDTSRSALEPMLHASAVWMAFDQDEAAALGRLDSAPKQLSEEAIAWAELNGLFARKSGQDEALALAVRTTRYGCQTQGGHGAYSKRAFDLLRSKFPESDAAKRTKYWFDCKHFTYGCTDSTRDDQGYLGVEEELQPGEPAAGDKSAAPTPAPPPKLH